jgi:hypothetical protein
VPSGKAKVSSLVVILGAGIFMFMSMVLVLVLFLEGVLRERLWWVVVCFLVMSLVEVQDRWSLYSFQTNAIVFDFCDYLKSIDVRDILSMTGRNVVNCRP